MKLNKFEMEFRLVKALFFSEFNEINSRLVVLLFV